MVLLDANIVIYYLDDSSDNYEETLRTLRKLADEQEQLAVSHHIIEEVLHIFSRAMPEANLVDMVAKIAELPNLIFVEPAPSIDFAARYAKLCEQLSTGVNDALILQLMLDADIKMLFSYDKQLIKNASRLGLSEVRSIS